MDEIFEVHKKSSSVDKALKDPKWKKAIESELENIPYMVGQLGQF